MGLNKYKLNKWKNGMVEKDVTSCNFGNEVLYNGKDRGTDMGILQPFSNKTKYSSLVIPAVLRLFLIIDTGTSS